MSAHDPYRSWPVAIQCADGYALQGRLFEPPPGRARRDATVIVCPAIFVRQRFYGAFAAHLAGRGFEALTFDNRGMGRSLAAEQGGWDHRLGHWGQRDLPAMIAAARAAHPGHRLYVVGHSMGGQLAAISPAVHRLAGVVTVAATDAWWGHWSFPMNLAILAWYGLVPLAGRVLSTFPAAALGLGPDVASGLVRDWARWGRHRCYIHGPFGMKPQMGSYQGRVLAYSFSDDEHLGCGAAVEALHRHYVQADLQLRRVDPRRLGVARLGHFGYFREATGRTLWEETIAWMEQGPRSATCPHP